MNDLLIHEDVFENSQAANEDILDKLRKEYIESELNWAFAQQAFNESTIVMIKYTTMHENLLRATEKQSIAKVLYRRQASRVLQEALKE